MQKTLTPHISSILPCNQDEQNTLQIQSLSQLLKACGDPLRVKILQVLQSDTFGVLELTQLFDTKQSGMSHHLKVLSKEGLVETQREGNAIFYRRPFIPKSDHDQHAIEQLFELIDRFPLSPILATQIIKIWKKRAIQSQVFFAKNTERFQEQQELIANHEQYASASLELLNKTTFPSDATVLEVGPGEGLFLKPLSKTFTKVVALDNSENMLNSAQEFAKNEDLTNIQFYLGDTKIFRAQKQKVEAIVMNMVLHHIPAPAQVFHDVFDMLKPNGVFVLCDLSHHDQAWSKDSCGDLWLGFEAQELSSWAERAGFKEIKSVYIGLRNGFQVQLRKFIKPDFMSTTLNEFN
ncbi:MAG: ArsR family transcriptional regulator [Oleiphilaceae bacterium]|jgi:ubiquinone/menaquinone biosynthesis C-methylase UbiE/DNA-binding transcriptional ArsR family regulator